MATRWYPLWWNESHDGTWERIKEAIRRDWEQTKHDLRLDGGHELNQGAADTVRQASGRQAIPENDRPNPPKVIGSWDEAELPIGYGYGARQKYGAKHPIWDDDLEATLRSEWESDKARTRQPWDDAKRLVRHGYEYKLNL